VCACTSPPLNSGECDTHVTQMLADGGGDEALLLSLADYMGPFKQLLETCTSVATISGGTTTARAVKSSDPVPRSPEGSVANHRKQES
jgi:hypothetical protein